MRNATFPRLSLAAACLTLLSSVPAAADVPLKNWAPPGAPVLHADISDLGVFVAVNPCRVVDTRGGAPITGGKLAAGEIRSYDLNSAGPPCTGIPVGVAAYSLNVTVTETNGGGFVSAYPTGPMPNPLTSTVNYSGANQTVANAAIVPCNSAGSIDVVAGVSGTHLIIDINGYYADGGTDNSSGKRLSIVGTSSSALVNVYNKDAVSNLSNTSSVRAVMITPVDGPAAVRGEQLGGSGINYGGYFSNAASTGIGVLGRNGSVPVTPPVSGTGVVGLSPYLGVWGLSNGEGVRGTIFDSNTGSTITRGVVGLAAGDFGIFSFDNLGASGTKSFVEPHPADAGKTISFVALEGNEAGTYFRGRGRFVGKSATIAVPEDFRLVSFEEGLSVQVTPIGELATVAVVSTSLDRIELKSSRDVEFFYTVNGVRRAFPKWETVREEGPHGIYTPEGPSVRIESVSRIEEHKRRLVANGTFNPDGTVNLRTAERLGWARRWRDDEAARAGLSRAAEQESSR